MFLFPLVLFLFVVLFGVAVIVFAAARPAPQRVVRRRSDE